MPLFRNLDNFKSHKISSLWMLPIIMLLALSFIANVFQLKNQAKKDEEITQARIDILKAQGKPEQAQAVEKVNSLPEFVFDLGLEFFKTIFFGLAVALLVDIYLKQLEGDSLKDKLEKSHVAEIYPSRQAALNRFINLVQNKKTKRIDILGISLREFLTEQGKMRVVWDAIVARLNQEEKTNTPEHKRLRIRLLMLDPKSSEGYFRYKIEQPDAVELHSDIDLGLIEIKRVNENIYSAKTPFFASRLYEHCPFAFMFITNTTSFVEQYYYHNPQQKKSWSENGFCLIEYQLEKPNYECIENTFNTIWKYGHEERIEIGTAISVEQAGIKSIYRENKVIEQVKQQAKSIKETIAGTIDILSVSGKHYVEGAELSSSLIEISNPENEAALTVRWALVNPVSEQAIYKAITDAYAVTNISKALEDYSWDKHQRSRLYNNVSATMATIQEGINNKQTFEVRLYSCSISNKLLLTENSLFVGQYIYGKSQKRQMMQELKSEYPLIEYVRRKENKSVEQELIESTFDIIWNYFSLPYEIFAEINQQEEFEKNLMKIKTGWINAKTPLEKAEDTSDKSVS